MKKYSGRIVMMALIGQFAALCYVVLLVRFYIGPQMVHAGNAVCILAAFLLGGWPGGLAGSVGMGLFDLTNGHADSTPKTLVLKFGIGLIAGLVFWQGQKHPDRTPLRMTALTAAISLLSGLGLFVLMLSGQLGSVDGKAFDKLWLAVLLLLVLGITLAAEMMYHLAVRKLSRVTQYAMLAATLAVAFNVAGEFTWYFVTQLLLGSTAQAAFNYTIVNIPATFINGTFSVFLSVALLLPIRAALVKAKFIRDWT